MSKKSKIEELYKKFCEMRFCKINPYNIDLFVEYLEARIKYPDTKIVSYEFKAFVINTIEKNQDYVTKEDAIKLATANIFKMERRSFLINIFRKHFSKAELLEYFNNYYMIYFIENIILSQKDIEEYFEVLSEQDKILECKLFMEKIFNLMINNNPEKVIRVAKNKELNDYICNLLISNDLYTDIIMKVYNKNVILILNELLTTNISFSQKEHNILYNYAKTNRLYFYNDNIYNTLLEHSHEIWNLNPRHNKEIFKLSIRRKYTDIILSHLCNYDIYKIEKYFYYLVDRNQIDRNYFVDHNQIDYNKIDIILKNCKSIDINLILDSIYFRFYKPECTLSEILCKYIDKSLITFELLKKFMKINAYIDNLERFDIPYDEKLYLLCVINYTFPKSYIDKINIDKNIMFMRQYYYNNPSNKKYKELSNHIKKHNLKMDEFCVAHYYKTLLYKDTSGDKISICGKEHKKTFLSLCYINMEKYCSGKVNSDIINSLYNYYKI